MLVVAALGACAADQGTATTGNPPDESSSASSSSQSSSSSGEASAEIKLTGVEFKYNGGGSTTPVKAGKVKVTLTNGGIEPHQATIVRLNDGVDLAAFSAASDAASSFRLVTTYGGPNAVAPGQVVSTTQVLDKPGTYLFVCFIPSADGVPHAAKGMVTPFAVTGSATDTVTAPTTITAADFDYKVPGSLTSGTIALKNEGTQPHELVSYKLADGKTAADVLAYARTPSGPPPFSAAGGIAALTPGSSASTDLTLTAGKYVFICFIPDLAGDGAPHFTKGMVTTVTVS
jgi:uncharacterized cupredoxin-like copper-binding protein